MLNKLSKKGAMFGLDARIALAIFGALSVISGAALYSAIQQAKLTSYMTEAQEIFKAFEALYVDIGRIPVHSSTDDNYDSNALTTDTGDTGWNGPYLSITTTELSNHYYMSGTLFDEYDLRMRNLKNADWATDDNYGSYISCLAGESCSIWMQLSTSSNNILKVGAKMDEVFDSSNGDNTGMIRYGENIGGGTYYIYIKGFVINSQS
jgi:hypothetical protein